MKTQEVGGRVNATNIIEGVSPQWNEMIYAEISEDSANSEGKIDASEDRPMFFSL